MTDCNASGTRIGRLIFSLMAVALFSVSTASAEEKVRDVAATVRTPRTIAAFVRGAAEAYMAQQPETLISVMTSNSYRSFKGVIERTTDIGMTASVDIPPTLRRDMQLRKENLILKPIGIEAVVAVVHATNPIKNLTLEQLRQVFTGEISNWKDLGYKDAPITLIMPPPVDALTDFIYETVLDGGHLTPKLNVSDTLVIDDKVAENPNAIGVIPLSFVTKDAKVLSIDGFVPNVDNLKSKSYPMYRTLAVTYLDGAPHTVTDFAKFLTEPKGGQKYLGLIKAAPIE